jgi:glycosyltransferase involved in cell wall biosynthesis
VSDVGALRDIALDETFVVRPGDPDALAHAILRHLEHGPALRQAVLDFARERISWDTCARLSLELYRSILDEGPG